MTYAELYQALGDALKRHPEARDSEAWVAARRGQGQGYYDTDCVAVEVRADAAGVIILPEGDQ